ncbi:MAG TPA: glycosyltransferase N-terminal domain-containing protein, partial [Gemmatimonadales bacterium]|nr:glycosyltransferase N-terminal domain-containing protein [Gemmatimonadales bacterium]
MPTSAGRRRPSPLYRAAVRLARGVMPLAGALSPKARHGHAMREGAAARLAAWAADSRDPARPLLWLHAPSVGEGLQAEPVLRRLRARHPDWQYAWTFFSPSAERFAQRVGADVADYLPYDSRSNVSGVLDALRPDAVVFSKLDLWPELAAGAAARGVRVGLLAATVRPGSRRLRWPARDLLRPGYLAVAGAAAVAEEDAERLSRLGVPRPRIVVVGDTRYDSVLERVAVVDPRDPLLGHAAGGPALVAGSTWPEDEAALLRAFTLVRAAQPAARLILVPHEPTPEHLEGVDRAAARLGIPLPQRLSAAEGPAPFLLVDRTGVLAALYGAGELAYVGGGFGRAGLHSVLEPAAWGRPVLVGPRWRESR